MPESMTFQTFTATPDTDGDRAEVQRDGNHYMVTVRNVDGDFMTAFVSFADMLKLAQLVINRETQA